MTSNPLFADAKCGGIQSITDGGPVFLNRFE